MRLLNPCVGVVTYPFYLFSGQSTATLQTEANYALNSTILLQYPDFASQYIRYVCTQVYLKCYPNVDLQNVNTYNAQVYQQDLSVYYPVPFQRPSKSTCDAMVASAPSTIRLGWGINSTTCQARFDYSFGDVITGTPYFFDQSNSVDSYVAPLTLIGGPIEKYAGTFCKGLVNNFIVPPANKLSNLTTSFSVTQLPGVTQTLIEYGFAKLQKRTIFLKQDCMEAMKRYVCSPILAEPEAVTLRQALVYSDMSAYISVFEGKSPGITNSTLQLPSYPDQFYCTNYSVICASFIAIAPKNLKANCSRTLPGGNIHMYPSTIQTVATVVTAAGPVHYPTQPNSHAYFNATQYGYYYPDCPAGFVVPEHPGDDNIQWIQGTGCANACRLVAPRNPPKTSL